MLGPIAIAIASSTVYRRAITRVGSQMCTQVFGPLCTRAKLPTERARRTQCTDGMFVLLPLLRSNELSRAKFFVCAALLLCSKCDFAMMHGG